jgi:DNA polymerase III delta prime subunit
MMRDWLHDLRYRSDEWRVYWIEEADALNREVEVLMLQFLDDMPEKTAALLTSNESMSGISGRLQSRTQVIRFDRPSTNDVASFLLRHWPELENDASEIANTNGGDIRASLNDAQMHLDVKRYGIRA